MDTLYVEKEVSESRYTEAQANYDVVLEDGPMKYADLI